MAITSILPSETRDEGGMGQKGLRNDSGRRPQLPSEKPCHTPMDPTAWTWPATQMHLLEG